MTILLVILGAVVLLLLLGFTLPDKVHVERTIEIEAPPESVFALIGDLQEFNRWSPWYERDPDMEQSIEGTAGVGQVMRWNSDKPNVGSGSQEIVEHVPPGRLVTRLNFGAQGGGVATFDIEAAGGGASRVTWSLDTRMREGVPVPMRPMATFMGFMMDKWVGADYEAGLAKLKQVLAEQASTP